MRISDWSSDVCSSDLDREHDTGDRRIERGGNTGRATGEDQAAPDTRRIVTPDEVRDRRAALYGRAFAATRFAAPQTAEGRRVGQEEVGECIYGGAAEHVPKQKTKKYVHDNI